MSSALLNNSNLEIELERQAVVKEALSWKNTPFHVAAKLKGIGADCAFVGESFKAVLGDRFKEVDYRSDEQGGEFPASWQWHMHTREEKYMGRLYEHGFIDIQEKEALPGDVVLAKFGFVHSHLALVIDWPKVIQAESCAGGRGKIVLADVQTNYWLSGIEDRDLRYFSLKIWRENARG